MKLNFMTTPEIAWEAFLAGKPFINTERNRLILQFSPEAIQSEMRLDDPDNLSLDYTIKLMGFMLFVDKPKTLTVIGLGGGSIPKYCYNHIPECKISVAEINADVIAMRNDFLIPAENDRFSVHCINGANFVSQLHETEDVIIVDGFDVGGQPPELCSKEFYDHCYHALTSNGILAINLADSYKKHPAMLGRLKRTFSNNIILVNTKDCTNKVVFAFKNKKMRTSEQALIDRANMLEQMQPLAYKHIVERILVNQHNTKLVQLKET